MSAAVVSLAEWREARFGPDDDLPPAAPALRLVAAGEVRTMRSGSRCSWRGHAQ